MRSCADTEISPWMKFGVNQNMGQDAGNLIEGGNNPKEVILEFICSLRQYGEEMRYTLVGI